MIIPLHGAPFSVTGHPINGERLVRFIIIDEAGTSAKEPVAVVVGLLVHADRQWKALERRRQEILATFIPDGYRDIVIFHAKELFSGGKNFSREAWPRELRDAMLKALLRTIPEYDIPVAIGYCFREFSEAVMQRGKGESDMQETELRHALAYTACLNGAEKFMRLAADEGEVALAVAEDVPKIRRYIKWTHEKLKPESKLQLQPFRSFGPLNHIVDTVHFAEKRDSPLLQFADACAFAFRRCLSGQSRGDELAKIALPEDLDYFEEVRTGKREFGFEIIVHGDEVAAAMGERERKQIASPRPINAKPLSL